MRAQMEAEEALREHEYERECKREEKRRKHEYELKRLELEAGGGAARMTGAHDARSKTPKLPRFLTATTNYTATSSILSGSPEEVRGKKTNGPHT